MAANTITLSIAGSVDLNLIPAQPAPTVTGILKLEFPDITFSGGQPMAFTMGVAATASATVTWVDASGNVAQVDGPTTWASSDPTILTVTADSTDSTKATVTGVAVGTAQATASADADLGAGMRTITAMGDVTVIAGEAVAGTITFEANPPSP